MGSITIVNKHYYKGPMIHGDRSSVLGNRYSHLPISRGLFKTKTREMAIKLGSKDLYDRLVKGDDSELIDAIADLIIRYSKGEHIVLGCWCKPRDCHLDYIKECIENDIFIMIPHIANKVFINHN